MKSKIILFAFVLLSSCFSTNSVVDKIVKNNLMETEFVGYFGKKSKEFKRFQSLKEKATTEELIKLKEHTNPIVRTYAFISLIERKPSSIIDTFSEALKNNESFGKQSADIIFGTDICSEIYLYSEHMYQDINLINRLDSIIIYKIDKTHFLHSKALNNKSYSNKFNERIIELALQGNNNSAIFYINKHAIEVDKSKLIESIEYILENEFIGLNPEKKMKVILDELEK